MNIFKKMRVILGENMKSDQNNMLFIGDGFEQNFHKLITVNSSQD